MAERHEVRMSSELPPVLEGRGSGEDREIRRTAGIIVAAVILALMAAPSILRSEVLPECMMLQVLDVPCLFCGGTRSFASLATLDLMGAIQLNPLVALGTVAILIGAIACLKEPERAKLSVRWRWLWTLLGGALLVNWGYLFFYLPR